jgi:membrane-associated phospholipid phosphatase
MATHAPAASPSRPSADRGPTLRPGGTPSAGAPVRRRARRPFAVALGLTVVAFATTYALSRGTGVGRWLDRAASGDRLTADGWPFAQEAAATLLETINDLSLVAVAMLVIGIAVARRGIAVAAVLAGAIAGATISAEALKFGLGHLDAFGWETLRGHPGSFPSGHVTVALVVVLAALLAGASGGRRTAIALIGGLYTASVATAVVLLRWHLPSDALGGALLAVAWMAGAGWLLAGMRAEGGLSRTRAAVSPGRPMTVEG